jgi:hypothetical protein
MHFANRDNLGGALEAGNVVIGIRKTSPLYRDSNLQSVLAIVIFGNLILFRIWHLVLRISPLGRGHLYEEGKARYQVKAA